MMEKTCSLLNSRTGPFYSVLTTREFNDKNLGVGHYLSGTVRTTNHDEGGNLNVCSHTEATALIPAGYTFTGNHKSSQRVVVTSEFEFQ